MDNSELQKKIDEFLKEGNLKSSVKKELVLGAAGDALVKNASKNGINIKGFTHSLDNFFVNHIIKKHGDEKTEAKRGNVHITAEDIKNIPDILQSPDFIIYGTKTKTGNKAIVFAKKINNSTIFVEEIRTGKKTLAAQTLYKTPRTIDVSSIKDAPELYAHSDPGTIKIINVKEEIVKSMFLSDTKKKLIVTGILSKIKEAANAKFGILKKTREPKENGPQVVADSMKRHGSLPDNNIHHAHTPVNNKKLPAANVLTEPMNVRVGKTVIPCKKGILEGFRSVVRCMAKLVKENKRLRRELDCLTRNRRDGMGDNSDNIGY